MIWIVLFTLATAAAIGLLIWGLSIKKAAAQHTATLTAELDDARVQLAQRLAENTDLDKQLAAEQAKVESFDQRLEDRDEAHRQAMKLVEDKFKTLAEDVLESSRKKLGVAANDELDKRRVAIDHMLKPIRESLDKHAKAVTDIEKQREGAYAGLRQLIDSMHGSYKELGQQTRGLVSALRKSEVRGRWGEVQLRRVAEMAGMIPYCDFEDQLTVTDSDANRLRPDMVVRLPADRTIVVDAKTPMTAFLDAVESEDDADRTTNLQRHAGHIQQKVKDLAAKRYQDQFDRSPDFTILFIPGEGFLQAAVQIDPQLIESAMARGVVIASPTTLITLLKAVEVGWREQRVAENAKRISDLGQELHERIAVLTGHAQNVGKHLGNAVGSYNSFLGSLESRVLVTTRKFKDLGAGSPKELPAEHAIKPIEQQPREAPALD
ncbi:MAG: DNA recombination protein RmuC [Planctomycetota bacterium]